MYKIQIFSNYNSYNMQNYLILLLNNSNVVPIHSINWYLGNI